jgi:hypothetical protein
MSVRKSPKLLSAIAGLRQRLGQDYFVLIDHWPDARDAIGLAHPSDPSRLVYLSVLDRRPDHFFVSLETARSGDWESFPYTQGPDGLLLGLDAVAERLRSHFVGTAA